MKMRINLKEKIKDGLVYFQKKNWIITILLFFVILLLALVVWQDCILNPSPSKTTLDNIAKVEQEFKTKMSDIKKNHQILKDQEQRFNNPKKNTRNRNYFEPLEEVPDLPSLEKNPTDKNFNPEIVL
jgi:hypothetical protein